MEINNNVAQTAYTPAPTAQTHTSPQKPAEEAAASAIVSDDAAVYEASGTSSKKGPANASEVRRIMEETNRQTESLRELIIKMFNRQAEKNGQANGGGAFLRPGEMVDIDPETRAKAQEDIAEGGYYSVESTATRIFGSPNIRQPTRLCRGTGRTGDGTSFAKPRVLPY